ncbi:TaqI-like C-terminal specificity domain-containing protein [Sutterella megalosphaeroides]|uniref:TaqI-like C-terminal specificity domain-containing protein n=1 Tax=Sutterella megalosphaeroides TaxID=2494234 RepID=UPI001472E543|nr:TaqI-like C-terminal specificity domain-containing protein [Sutterella megalosphaeroides]
MFNQGNVISIRAIVDYIEDNNISIQSALLSLGINLLKANRLCHKKHVAETIEAYKEIGFDDYLSNIRLPTDEFDLLGLVYQFLLPEGHKNLMGSYYTPKAVVENMINDLSFSKGECFLDPCCGSGIFLLSASAVHPTQLFGFDIDPIAVMIAKINLLIKYWSFDFTPQVYNLDFSVEQDLPLLGGKFDYIATNPPWGAKNHTSDQDSFSRIFIKAFSLLKKSGTIKFLFPESILNVKSHRSVRQFILENGLAKVSLYDEFFSGVTTKYVDIECCPSHKTDNFVVCKGGDEQVVHLHTVYETENYNFNFLSEKDLAIIKTVKAVGCYFLKDSVWGLGIVTGDNKKKLFSEPSDGMEKIYTGKEIRPYRLNPAQKYISYDRGNLQQVAREEIYRAPEKLVYKFISKKLVFSYDDSSSLFLNSANILIPEIPSMSIKTVMAFLNSPLFQFMYMKLFGEVKVLKGNLLELPFPKISREDDERLQLLVDEVLRGDDSKKVEIEDIVFSIYDLNDEQIRYIKDVVYGKVN